MNKLAVAVLFLAGCSQGVSFDAESMAKKIVQSNLKDPDSARWGEIQVAPLHELYVACGTVNSKNAFGGYAGDTFFQAKFTPDGKGSAEFADSPGYALMMDGTCKIYLDVANRHSPKSKWAAEKKEIIDRVTASIKELAPLAVKLNHAND